MRGLSYLTGFLVTPLGSKSCTLGYVAHSDPGNIKYILSFSLSPPLGGQLPSWVTNKLSSILAPKMVKKIHKACLNYNSWKVRHRFHYNPPFIPLTSVSSETSQPEPQTLALPRADINHQDCGERLCPVSQVADIVTLT